MTARLLAFLRDERGATALEYGLIVSLLVVGTITAMTFFAGKVTAMWNSIAAKF